MFEMFKDENQEWRFRLKAQNGKIIAASESYKTYKGCLNGIKSVLENTQFPRIKNLVEDKMVLV